MAQPSTKQILSRPLVRSSQSSRAASSDAHNHLILQDVPGKGRGVFAQVPLTVGSEVLEFCGDRCHVTDLVDLTHALQIGHREFLCASGGIDDFVNHSCAPNCGIRQNHSGAVVLFALRNIQVGEEITFDYSTTQTGGHWHMTCQCGTPECRTNIGDFEDLPVSRQNYYISRGAVLPFLLLAQSKL